MGGEGGGGGGGLCYELVIMHKDYHFVLFNMLTRHHTHNIYLHIEVVNRRPQSMYTTMCYVMQIVSNNNQ